VHSDRGLCALRKHHRCKPCALLLQIFPCFQPLLAAQFHQIFQLFARRILAPEVPLPAIERALCQVKLATVFRPRQTAALPCLDVHPPARPPSRVLEMSQSHRQSSRSRKNPRCRAIVPPQRHASSERLHSRSGWQDKMPRGAALGGCGFSIGYKEILHIASHGHEPANSSLFP